MKQRGLLQGRLRMETSERQRVQALLEERANREAAIAESRSQPKSPDVEAELAARYGSMELEERAFNILLDIGMIESNPDPDSADYDSSNDDEFC